MLNQTQHGALDLPQDPLDMGDLKNHKGSNVSRLNGKMRGQGNNSVKGLVVQVA